MKRHTNRTQLSQVAGLLSLGLLLQIACTYPLWMYHEWRNLPNVPFSQLALEWLAFDVFNFLLLVAVLIVIMFAPHRKGWYLAFVVLMITLWLQDSSRLQYSLYTFSTLLALLYFDWYKYEAQLTQALQLAIIGMYIWAGIYQLHPQHIDWIITLNGWFGITATSEHYPLAYLPGAFALLTAAGLFFPQTRLYALGTAALYHVVQVGFYWLPTADYHWSQWIFHGISICLLFVLFAQSPRSLFDRAQQHLKTFPIVPYALIIFGTFPLLQFSFDLPPALTLRPPALPTTDITFFFHRQDRFCLPPTVEPFVFTKSTEIADQKILHLSVNKWFATELGVPLQINKTQQQQLLQQLCRCLDYQHQGGFTVVERNWWQEEEISELRCKKVVQR